MLVYRLARDWFDAETALFAAALVAWNPLFITYAKQPMSDMPATMWVMLALVLALRSSSANGILRRARGRSRGHHSAGVAHRRRGDSARRASRRDAAAPHGDQRRRLLIGVIVQMAIQNQLFGSPFSTGYGATTSLFSVSHVGDQSRNLRASRLDGGRTVVGSGIDHRALRGEAGAALEAGGDLRRGHAAVSVLSALRSLGDVAIPASRHRAAHDVVAAGLMHIARVPRKPAVTAAVIVAFIAIVAGRSEILLREIERLGRGVDGSPVSAGRRVDQRQHAAGERRAGESAQRLAAVVRQASDHAGGTSSRLSSS